MINQLPLSNETTRLPEKSQPKSWETQIFEAIHAKKIGEYTTTNDFLEINNLLTFWRNQLGIKDEMTAEELEMYIIHVKELYSDFSCEMIRMAIKSSLKGELKCDVRPYGSFSCFYISTILNAYKSYSRNIISERLLAIEKERIREINKPVERTEDEKLKNRLFYLNDYKSKVLNGYLPDFKRIMWQFLSSNNLLTGIEPDIKLIEKERLKAQSNFIDFGIEEQGKLEAYSIMRKFFEMNPEFNFTEYKVL